MIYQIEIAFEIIGDTLHVIEVKEEMASGSVAASESFLSSIENAICSNDPKEVTQVWVASYMSFSYLLKEGETSAQFLDRTGWTVVPPFSTRVSNYTYLIVRSERHLNLNRNTISQNHSIPTLVRPTSVSQSSSTGSSKNNSSSDNTEKINVPWYLAIDPIVSGCFAFPLFVLVLILIIAGTFNVRLGDLTIIYLVLMPVGGLVGYGIFYWWCQRYGQ